MKNFSARIPLVRLLLPFVIGIAVAYSFRIQINIYFLLAGIISLAMVVLLQRKLLKVSLRWIGFDGFIIAIVFFLTGVGITSMALQQNSLSPLNENEKVSALHVRLLNDVVVKEKSAKLAAEILEYKTGAEWKPSGEKIIVYIARDGAAEKLKYGDDILIHASPSLVEGPKNPEEFDYRAWLERQGVRGQVYAKSDQWELLSENNGNWFKKAALDLRRYFLGKLQSYGMSGAAFGVSAALLLGASDHLDPGTIQAYSASGTLHVLSVSGMHVALVYVVLLKLLAPLGKRKGGKWSSIIIQLLFLWFYATLTGLCPSVLRSVTMLSVVIAGRAFNKNAHILNSLAASALILLVADPLLLFDIGFQLSYLAVAGIVLLQPPLETIFNPRFWITKQIWTLVSVTLVAQVFTFPLGFYYFKQFPTYFLLSNLVVIPLSTITMYAGLVLLILSPFTFLAKPVAVVFQLLVELLNASVSGIEHLPAAVVRSGKWSLWEMLIIYFTIFAMLFFLMKKNKRMLQVGFVGVFLLLLFTSFSKMKSTSKSEIVFFDINHSTAILVARGNDCVLFADTTLLKRKGDIDFHIEPLLKAVDSDDEKIVSLEDSTPFRNPFVYEKNQWIAAGKKHIMLVGNNFFGGKENNKADIIVLRENSNAQLDSLIRETKAGLIIADGSDAEWKIKKWEIICRQMSVPFCNVKDKGALVIEN